MTSLLSSSEVIHFSGISRDFPPCDFRLLYNVELTEFRRCLGLEFYTDLQNDRVDYSGEADWQHGVTYNQNAIVVKNGVPYVSLENSNQSEPPSPKWEIAPKFTTECYNDLWCLFLGEYLSWNAIKDKFAFVQYNLSGEGIQLVNTRAGRSADVSEFKIYGASVDKKIEDLYNNMDHYLKNNCEEEFKNYKGNLDDCEDGKCTKGNRYRVG